MFISSNDDIIEMLTAGDHDDFGSEKLKSLMKLLPETEEVNLRDIFLEKCPNISFIWICYLSLHWYYI